jgi:hypothetical protein
MGGDLLVKGASNLNEAKDDRLVLSWASETKDKTRQVKIETKDKASQNKDKRK